MKTLEIDYAKLETEVKRYTGTVEKETPTAILLKLTEKDAKGKNAYRTLTKSKIVKMSEVG